MADKKKSKDYLAELMKKPIVEEMEPKAEVEVVSEDEETLPTTEATCEKCGHETAYFWLQQTRAGDEPETKFLKCAECKHTWRDYS